MQKILVVDDEAPMRELVRFYLERHDFDVSEASSGGEAFEMVQKGNYDLLLVDWMMPQVDGLEFCRRVRRLSSIPIIMLTARTQLQDKVEGFEGGADDYVTKPFAEAELVARIKAVLRRSQTRASGHPNRLYHEGLSMNLDTYEVAYGGQPLSLTPHEFELLQFLLMHPGMVFSREQLIERVWGYDFEGDVRTVDSHVRNLRAKLRKAGIEHMIKTVWGMGYQLV